MCLQLALFRTRTNSSSQELETIMSMQLT